MRRLLLALPLALTLATAAHAQSSFSSLEERMSAADFRRAGLDKLTPEELAALNAWLQRSGTTAGAPAPAPRGDDRVGFSSGGFFDRNEGQDRVTSTIVGTFEGWRGAGERITLANGQVWRITDSSTRLSVNLTDPRVTIEQSGLGGWFLKVDGYNTRARVVRER